MNTNLAGARVVLTGCTANIGRAAALAFADEGARLVLVDRDTAAQATADAISAEGGEATFVAADVSDEDSVAAMLREADDRLGGLDVIVNNAGLQRAGSVTEMTLADWDALMSVNPRSCFLTAKHGVPIFRRGGGGVFVNMASLAAVKGAIVAFTRALAAEVAPDGIRANALCPGWVDTPFNDPAQDFLGGREALESAVRAGVPLGRQASPEEMAQSLLFLASAASSYMTGQTLVVDGGVS
jgi:NAD(P)-dependent dehydrogenase (short-subunit alcohol dehydrogenase family)